MVFPEAGSVELEVLYVSIEEYRQLLFCTVKGTISDVRFLSKSSRGCDSNCL
jgi:hypothetical protein